MLGKLGRHVSDVAETGCLGFAFYRFLHIMDRRVGCKLPEAVFHDEGIWAYAESHLRPYMMADGAFVDVGANVGMRTSYVAKTTEPRSTASNLTLRLSPSSRGTAVVWAMSVSTTAL